MGVPVVLLRPRRGPLRHPRRHPVQRGGPAKAAGLPLTAYAGLSLPVVIELLLCRDQWADPEELSRAVEAAASRAFQAIEVPGTDEADEGDL